MHLIVYHFEAKTKKKKKKLEVPGEGGGITKTQHVSGGIPLLREAAGVGAKGARKRRQKKKKRGRFGSSQHA